MSKPSVKIVSGWSNPGGSTTAFINLCNMFNDNGIDCIFYGPHAWHMDKCRGLPLAEAGANPEDNTIFHFIKVSNKYPVRKMIYSCHETDLRPVKDIIPIAYYSFIHYVSEFQRDWHNVDHPSKVIPNVLPDLRKKLYKDSDVAGVIGSIDSHKRPHQSIQRALDDGFKEVHLYGAITEPDYFKKEVQPLLNDNVVWKEYSEDKQDMYNSLHSVYHSSKRETFNYIKAECELTGTEYHGLPENDPKATYMDNKQILELWKEALEL